MKAGKSLPPEISGERDTSTPPYSVPDSIRWRWLFGFVTIVLPVISFAITSIFPEFLKPEWQSGAVSDYVQLMLVSPVTFYYYPLLIYAMVSMGLLLGKPYKYEQQLPIRFGVYSGVILSLHYSLLVLLSEYDWIVIVSAGVWILYPLLIVWLIPLLRSRVSDSFKWIAVGINILMGFGFLGLVSQEGEFLLIVSLLAMGPIACLIISVWLSTKLIKHYGFLHSLKRQQRFGVVSLILVYIAAWQLAVVKTLELYAELPPTPPPDCYIATAAASGHPALVKSGPVRLPGGETMRVNPQLRYLKCGELILQNVTPRLHTLLRAIYDRLGRRLAARITHPLLADLAYLSLKPLEWGTKLWLSILVPNVNEIAARVYPDAASHDNRSD